MKSMKSIVILMITSFMAISLTGCSEKLLTKEEAKTKLEYDAKIMDALTKSAEAFPNNSEKIFKDSIKELEEDINSLFKKSKESSNLKVKDTLKKELKLFEVTYNTLLENSDRVPLYYDFFILEGITDKEKLAIKPLYEKSKKAVEADLTKFLDEIENNGKGTLVLNAITMSAEKETNLYKEFNEYYGFTEDAEYMKLYEEKVPKFKQEVDERITLENPEIKFVDIKLKSERESMFEKAEAEVEKGVQSGKLTFPSDIMSDEIIIKKSGSIYIVKSYVDITSNGATERKEFTVKFDVSMNYYMLISLHI